MPNLKAVKEEKRVASKKLITSLSEERALNYDGRFNDYLVKRNGAVEVMIDGASGESPMWKGNAKRRLVGRYNDPKKLNIMISALEVHGIEYTNVFVSFNKPKKEVIEGRQLNKLMVSGKFLKDEDILYRTHLFIDVDPVTKDRPVKEAITKQCVSVSKKINKELRKIGFPRPLVVKTGNGVALFYPLKNVKNSKKAKLLFRRLYKHLAKFSNSGAKVDISVGNASRYGRLPGTYNCKDIGNGEEYFQRCKVISFPDKIENIDFGRFKKIVEQLPVTPKVTTDSGCREDSKSSKRRYILDVEKYLEYYDIEIMDVKMIGGAKIFCLKECLFDNSHGPNDSAIVQQPNGKLSYHCFHDSCKDKTWKGARLKISGKKNIAKFMTGNVQVGQGDSRSYDNLTTISAVDIMRYAPSVESIIKNFLGKGEATIIAGSGGVGKSFITLYTALFGSSAKKGSSLFGEFEVMKPFSTLIIQAENAIQNIKPRLKLLTKKNPQFEPYVYQLKFVGRDGGCRITGVLSDQDFQEAIINQIRAAKVEVIILDPLISYSKESENDNSGMRWELDALRYIMDAADVSAFVVHHAGKGHSGKTSSVRGATAIFDWADNVVGLSSKDGGHLTLRCEKSRNSLGFKPVTVNMTGMRFERVVMSGDDKTETVLSALKALGGQASTQSELSSKIVELTDMGLSTAKREINKAVEAGLIKEVNNGRSKGYKAIERDEPDELDLNTVD